MKYYVEVERVQGNYDILSWERTILEHPDNIDFGELDQCEEYDSLEEALKAYQSAKIDTGISWMYGHGNVRLVDYRYANLVEYDEEEEEYGNEIASSREELIAEVEQHNAVALRLRTQDDEEE